MLLFLIYRNGYEAKPKSENLICGFGIFSGLVLQPTTLMILTSPVFKEITFLWRRRQRKVIFC